MNNIQIGNTLHRVKTLGILKYVIFVRKDVFSEKRKKKRKD